MEMADEIFSDLSPVQKAGAMGRIGRFALRIITGEKVLEISDHSVVTDKQTVEGIDSVVLAIGYKPNDRLVEELEEAEINHLEIGDAVKPRKIYQAVMEGFDAAYHL